MKSLVQPRAVNENIGPGYYLTENSQFKNNPSEVKGPKWELNKQ